MKKIVLVILFFASYFFAVQVQEWYVFYAAPLFPTPTSYPAPLKAHSTRAVYFLPSEQVIIKQAKKRTFSVMRKLVHEYAVLRSLEDLPHIPKVLGRIENSGFCMEYLSPLERATYTIDEARLIKEELLDTFKALHRRGIYHRDISYNGNNVIITKELSPYLIDFGNAIRLDPLSNLVLGPILARKDLMRLLGWFFYKYPDALTKDETERFLRYKRPLTKNPFFSYAPFFTIG